MLGFGERRDQPAGSQIKRVGSQVPPDVGSKKNGLGTVLLRLPPVVRRQVQDFRTKKIRVAESSEVKVCSLLAT